MNFRSTVNLHELSTMNGALLAKKGEHYTKTESQTSGQSQLHWGNLTNVPTSFPASGGNSDTVDNLHAASFMRTDVNTYTSGRLFAHRSFGTGDATISLAIGDGDTGFDWVGDGVLNIMTDSTVTAQIKKAGAIDFKIQPTMNGSTIYHAANFTPGDKFDKAGGTVTGATTFNSTVTVDSDLDVNGTKISMNKFSMEYNTSDDSVDFVFA